LEYLREYLDRGAEINGKDFADWTPFHCAVYTGNVLFIKELLDRPYILLHEKTDEGKTPI
jgi:ankyrin repeat protein